MIMNEVENIPNNVKNTAETVGNAVENTARDVSNASRNFTGSMENGMDNAASYTATRVSAEDNTFMGMTSNTMTWLVIGITAIAIIALIWYYFTQNNILSHDDDE